MTCRPIRWGQHHEHGLGIIEFFATMTDGKTHCRRVLFERFKSLDTPAEKEFEHFDFYARQFVAESSDAYGKPITIG